METEFKILANKVINVNGLPSKKKIIIFSLCLFISLFFWMLIKFSKEFQLTVLCPVSFVNLPTDKVLMDNKDTTFLVTIKSQGFNLLYYQFFKKKEILRIDASQLNYNSGLNDTICYLGASQITKLISKEFAFDYEILNVLPDTFKLHWEKAIFKKVPVKLNLSISYLQPFQLYDSVKIEPDSIYISGTESDLKNVRYITTKKIKLNNINKSQILLLDVIKPVNLPKIKLSSQKIKLIIPVEKFTEAEIEVSVKVSENSNMNNIRLFPDKIKITYQVALKDYKKVNQEMFVAVTSINKSKIDVDFNTKVVLIKYPAFVKISKIFPEKIEYVIFK